MNLRHLRPSPLETACDAPFALLTAQKHHTKAIVNLQPYANLTLREKGSTADDFPALLDRQPSRLKQRYKRFSESRLPHLLPLICRQVLSLIQLPVAVNTQRSHKAVVRFHAHPFTVYTPVGMRCLGHAIHPAVLAG